MNIKYFYSIFGISILNSNNLSESTQCDSRWKYKNISENILLVACLNLYVTCHFPNTVKGCCFFAALPAAVRQTVCIRWVGGTWALTWKGRTLYQQWMPKGPFSFRFQDQTQMLVWWWHEEAWVSFSVMSSISNTVTCVGLSEFLNWMNHFIRCLRWDCSGTPCNTKRKRPFSSSS